QIEFFGIDVLGRIVFPRVATQEVLRDLMGLVNECAELFRRVKTNHRILLRRGLLLPSGRSRANRVTIAPPDVLSRMRASPAVARRRYRSASRTGLPVCERARLRERCRRPDRRARRPYKSSGAAPPVRYRCLRP